jgi:hypothetical protein
VTARTALGRRFVVEVQEAKVPSHPATVRLWADFRQQAADRIVDITPGWTVGTLALISCDDHAAGEYLVWYLVGTVGLPRQAVRVRVLPVMTPVGPPGCCLHPVAEFVSYNSRTAARCLTCGYVERAS